MPVVPVSQYQYVCLSQEEKGNWVSPDEYGEEVALKRVALDQKALGQVALVGAGSLGETSPRHTPLQTAGVLFALFPCSCSRDRR